MKLRILKFSPFPSPIPSNIRHVGEKTRATTAATITTKLFCLKAFKRLYLPHKLIFLITRSSLLPDLAWMKSIRFALRRNGHT